MCREALNNETLERNKGSRASVLITVDLSGSGPFNTGMVKYFINAALVEIDFLFLGKLNAL